ncbi:hypothetical protein [Pseudanabaena sp. PCC 6802]|uniref:hypothetical protein n=1 Tax=Pseudanabaena sp. PCC 6802 TaxID=118173 RepID=UPI000349DAA1|nr:hypothetical protein [Pseudanabaena sp. PCC 6802]
MRAAQAKGVYAINLRVRDGCVAIGILVLSEPQGRVSLKDVDSEERLEVDLTGIEPGIIYDLEVSLASV